MPSARSLIAAARAARANAYAPYSHFAVGAAVETLDGTVITGANVENASYGLSICAERAALVRAVAEGHRGFRAVAVAGPEDATIAPCGACRQFIAEFDSAMPVAFTSPSGVVETTLAELLPYPFTPEALSRS
ncbi:MAG TPA: cytidine deaminase [Candidatus Dormibacteraeota bacterium]|nr:cytidine deaminase [Candidatus Dormibacteraeota bacterium]